MATELEVLMAARVLKRCIVLFDKTQQAVWCWTMAEQGQMRANHPLVLWLEDSLFWPGRGDARWSHYGMSCEPGGFEGGRTLPREWKLATLNGGGANPIRHQLQEWVEQGAWKPDILAFQEHRLGDLQQDGFTKQLKRLGYRSVLTPSLTGANGGRSAGVGVAIKTNIPFVREPLNEDFLHGRALALHVRGLTPGGFRVLVVYLQVGASEQHRLQELSAISRWLALQPLPWCVLGDFNEQPQLLENAGWLEHIGGQSLCTSAPTTDAGSWIDYFVVSPELAAKHWNAQVEEAPLIKVHKPIMLSIAGHEAASEAVWVAVKAKPLPEDAPVGPVCQPDEMLDPMSVQGLEQQWGIWSKSAERYVQRNWGHLAPLGRTSRGTFTMKRTTATKLYSQRRLDRGGAAETLARRLLQVDPFQASESLWIQLIERMEALNEADKEAGLDPNTWRQAREGHQESAAQVITWAQSAIRKAAHESVIRWRAWVADATVGHARSAYKWLRESLPPQGNTLATSGPSQGHQALP
eukprot:4949227-Amphidinium_carterae.3